MQYSIFGKDCIKIDEIQSKIQLVESIFDVNYAKIGFSGLTPDQKFKTSALHLTDLSNFVTDCSAMFDKKLDEALANAKQQMDYQLTRALKVLQEVIRNPPNDKGHTKPNEN